MMRLRLYHCLVVAETPLQEEITKHRVQGNGQQQSQGEDEQVNRRALIHLVAVRIMTEWRARPDQIDEESVLPQQQPGYCSVVY